MRVDVDSAALTSELQSLVRQRARTFLLPTAEEVTAEATRIAFRNFRHVGAGVASIHNEYYAPRTEYRISYDGDQHSYMGLWEIGTREFAPRPYLRPAVDSVNRRRT